MTDRTGAALQMAERKDIAPQRVIKSDEKQIIYCVVLEPEVEDLQGDVVSAEEIEKAAHDYMVFSRTIGDAHKSWTEAAPVESFIAPVDMVVEGESIKKGTWVMAIKVFAPAMWEAVKSGAYTGVSIGGQAFRDEL